MNLHFEKIDKIIISKINEANFSLIIAVAWITDNNIIRAIERSLDRNVDVQIIFYKDNINKLDNFKRIYEKGGNINYCKFLMHNKFCIIDKKTIINGSYNWTNSAKYNKENIQVWESKEHVIEFLAEFQNLKSKSVSIDNHFEDRNKKFNQYLNDFTIPKKFPVICRFDLEGRMRSNIFFYNYDEMKMFDHLYKIFDDEIQYLKFQEELYTFKYEKKPLSKLNFTKTFAGCGSDKLIIDVITLDNVKKFTEISSSDYIDNKIRLCQEKFIYFENSFYENVAFISYDKYSKYNTIYGYDDDRKYYGKYKSQTEIIGTYLSNNEYCYKSHKFNKLFIDSNYLVADLVVANYDTKHLIYEKYFFDIKNLLIDYEKSKSYNDDQKQYFDHLKLEVKKSKIEYQKKNPPNADLKCYIATMVYGDQNHINVQELRMFRDNHLSNSYLGVIFIKLYYFISPYIVKIFSNNIIIKKIFKILIERIILKIFRSYHNNN